MFRTWWYLHRSVLLGADAITKIPKRIGLKPKNLNLAFLARAKATQQWSYEKDVSRRLFSALSQECVDENQK